MEWVQIVSEYGALGVLIILMALFAKGQVVSKKTMQDMNNAYKESMTELKTSFEVTVGRICESHENQVKIMTTSFTRQISSLKAVIQIMKRENGVK